MPVSPSTDIWRLTTMANICIEDDNLSRAWARAARPLLGGGDSDRGPVIVSIQRFPNGAPEESVAIRDAVNALLPEGGQCETVANTIFPASLWNPALPRKELFNRYTRI